MPLDFSQPAEEKDFGLMPKGQLAWTIFKVREYKTSQAGNKYLDVELTVNEGQPYAKKKLWINIMDPLAPNNTDGAKNMGLMMLRRIMEAAMGATPDNPASYQKINRYEDLNGLLVPVMVTIEKSDDPEYDDKNSVEFLSPFSGVSKIVKAYNMLAEDKVYNINSSPKSSHQSSNPQASANQPFGQGFNQHTPQQQQAPQPQQQAPNVVPNQQQQNPNQPPATPTAPNQGPATANPAPQQQQSASGGWVQQGNPFGKPGDTPF